MHEDHETIAVPLTELTFFILHSAQARNERKTLMRVREQEGVVVG